jgi:ABC-2 type transport system permease protein
VTRFLRSAFVIARRDFSATVLSKAFIFFLIGPLFPLLLGGVFGSIGATVASQAEQPVAAVIGPKAEFDRLLAARQQLAEAVGDGSIVGLVGYGAEADLLAQQKKLLSSPKPPIRAVLTGGIDHPRLLGAGNDDESVLNQLRLIINTARQPAPRAMPVADLGKVDSGAGSLAKERSETALYGQMLLFFLTLLLSGMVLSQLIEEKSNKVIEVIAAAIPIDAMFVGKLFAMLAASVVGLVVWISAGALFIQLVKHGGVHTLTPPAVGWPAFLALAVSYFSMNYLLVGAVFLTIGAQASTSREVQTLSMPATFGQVLIFGFAAKSIGSPDSTAGLIGAIFPLSSPMAMLARAAELPELWPHVMALIWQAIWVIVIVRAGALLFRKTVLKSGPRTRWWKRTKKTV